MGRERNGSLQKAINRELESKGKAVKKPKVPLSRVRAGSAAKTSDKEEQKRVVENKKPQLPPRQLTVRNQSGQIIPPKQQAEKPGDDN
jgi:hypothetical protein